MTRIIFIRHCEAKKNLEDRHGGEGTSLTVAGQAQAAHLARLVAKAGNTPRMILAHQVPQVSETANILASYFEVELRYEEGLKGLDLGGLAGLSRKQAMLAYPEAAGQLEAWRQGRLCIEELSLPGGERFTDFVDRLLNTVSVIARSESGTVIAVVSRSVAIFMKNFVSAGNRVDLPSYEAHEIDFGEQIICEVPERWELGS